MSDTNMDVPHWAAFGGLFNGHNGVFGNNNNGGAAYLSSRMDNLHQVEHAQGEFDSLDNTLEHLAGSVKDGHVQTVTGLAENKYNTMAVGQEIVKDVIKENGAIRSEIQQAKSDMMASQAGIILEMAKQHAETQKTTMSEASKTRELNLKESAKTREKIVEESYKTREAASNMKIDDLRGALISANNAANTNAAAVSTIAAHTGGFSVGNTSATNSGFQG